jgi:hypothetical protein
MNGYPKARLYFWLGLICISVLYCLYYLYFLYKVSDDIPLKIRHIGKFLFILAAYGIGVVTLKKQGPAWMVMIWHVIYGAVLLLLLMLGVHDWMVARSTLNQRILAYDLQEILISPILYVGITLIRKSLLK